ncbi:MAG: pirin family protein [Chitinophagaceae bacterium]
MKKKIQHILLGREKQISAEETVKQPLPHKDFRFANPIIVLHHLGPRTIAPGSKERIHPHPHRGFSPYTFMLQGEGFHRDNAGNDHTVSAGGVQWMFAGKGILHSEGPTDALLKNGGIQESIQLWINAPRSQKWNQPFYQSASEEEQPVAIEQDGVSFRLASGSYNGQDGPVQQFTPVISMLGSIAAGKEVLLNAEPGYWTLLYVISGDVMVNDEPVTPYHLVIFEKENTSVALMASTDARVLFLSAEPLDEPVAAKDNFVMNTSEEVEQAIDDYKQGKFGDLSY